MVHTEWVSSGDVEIDQMRQDVRRIPTDADNFPSRMALLTTWINLLQRQGYDLTNYVPIFDKLTTSARSGDNKRLFAAIHDAFDHLDGVQRSKPLQSFESDTETTDPQQPPEDWPVYGGNIHHTASTDQPGPVKGHLAWKKAIGLAWYVRPAVEDGRVYATSPGIRGMLHCLDLDTGQCLWKTRRSWTREALGIVNLSPSSYVVPGAASTPVVLDDVIVLNELGAQGRDFGARHLLFIDKATGELIHRSPAGQADYRNGYAPLAGNSEFLVFPTGTQRVQDKPPQHIVQNRIVCKRAGDGETLWDFHIGPTFCEPIVDDDQTFVGTADGLFSCLNMAGGSRREHFGFSDQRRVAWQFKAGGAVNTPATTDDKRVFFGANDGVMTCLDKSSGAIIWQTEIDDKEPRSFKFFSKPVLNGNHLYVGTAARHLYCLDASSGQKRWAVPMEDWIRSAPVVHGDTVWVVAMDGTAYCLRDKGESVAVLWQRKIGAHPVYADLVYADGRLLVSSSDLRLWCLDAQTGEVIWQHSALDEVAIRGRRYRADELACGGWYQSKPTAADGTIFVGTPSRFVFALDHETGAEKWRFEMGGAVSGAPAYADGRIFIGQKGDEYFFCLDANTGQPIWKQLVGWVWSSANVDSGRVLIPGNDGHLSCLDADTGHILWRYRTGSGAAPEPPIDSGRVYFGSWDHYVYAFETTTGRLLWQFHTGGSPDSGAPIAYEDKLYVPMGGKRLCCLDAATGTVIWEHHHTEGDMNASPALWNDRLFISLGIRPGAIPIASRIRCLNASNGTLIWEHSGGGITGPSVADGKVYFAATSDPFFRCVDATGNGYGTTNCLWRYEMGERVYESVPAIYAGRIFILSEHGFLYSFD